MMSIMKTKQHSYIAFATPLFGNHIESILEFSLYQKNKKGEFIKLYERGETIEPRFFKKIIQSKGEFYISKEEKNSLINYIGSHTGGMGQGFSKPQLESTQDVLKPIIELALNDLENHLPQVLKAKVIESYPLIIQAIADTAQTAQGMSLVLRLLCSHDYLIRHSLFVAGLSAIIASEMDWDTATRKSVAIGALLHDIGMLRIDEDLYIKPQLTDDDWLSMKGHPVIGAKMLSTFKGITELTKNIISSHHVQPNGRGYGEGSDPYGLIVGTLDAFSTLVIPTPYRFEGKPVEEAWRLLKQDESHFDPKTLKLIKEIFVYPALKLSA
jgi:putative nucleotidyltransferase with HDIG domain